MTTTASSTKLAIPGLLLALGVAGSAMANVRLPAVLSSGMVVQQSSDVWAWGWADPGEPVEVKASWTRDPVTTSASKDGRWKVQLNVPAAAGANGPQTITIKGKNTIELTDVLVGEVWVCSGQSNMEMLVGRIPGQLGGVDRWEDEVKSADIPDLRLFDVTNAVSLTPEPDCNGSWKHSSPQSAAAFSATAYFFGRALQKELGVPVGLISSDWGGTPIQAWTSLEGLKSQGGFEDWVARLERIRTDPEGVKRDNDAATAAWRKDLDAKDPGVAGGWMKPEFDDSSWKTMPVPAKWSGELADFDGFVWTRRGFDLTAEQSGKEATLELGPVDDHDETWVNGVKVGEHFEVGSHQTPRVYSVPKGTLHAGRNVVCVRVLDIIADGGMYGAPDSVRIKVGTGTSVPLAGDWKWRAGPEFKTLPRRPQFAVAGPGAPTALFNAMIAPITPYGARGIIWYQGESNRAEAFKYRTMFTAMIEDWRRLWQRPSLPFYFVQIAPFRYGNDRGETGELREAQAMALKLPDTGMAVTMDIGNPTDIHPTNKQEVGRRLALCALANTYGRKVEFSGPVYKSRSVEGSAIRLQFTHASGLTPAGVSLPFFAIAGEDHKFFPAEAKIDGETIVVRSDKVPAPKAVRFAWGDADAPNVKNGAALPAGPFRTDDWPGVTQPASK